MLYFISSVPYFLLHYHQYSSLQPHCLPSRTSDVLVSVLQSQRLFVSLTAFCCLSSPLPSLPITSCVPPLTTPYWELLRKPLATTPLKCVSLSNKFSCSDWHHNLALIERLAKLMQEKNLPNKQTLGCCLCL